MSRRARQLGRRRSRGGAGRLLFGAAGAIVGLLVIGACAGVAYIASIAASAPSLDQLKPADPGATSTVYAADGKTRLGFIQGNVSPLTEWPLAPADDLNKAGYGFYTAGIMEGLAQVPYEKLIEDDYVWVGTPQDIIERIEATQKVCEGIQEIGITVNAGGAAHWMAIKNQELFASAVMPHFAREVAAAGAAA